jgi:hypothetical protein
MEWRAQEITIDAGLTQPHGKVGGRTSWSYRKQVDHPSRWTLRPSAQVLQWLRSLGMSAEEGGGRGKMNGRCRRSADIIISPEGAEQSEDAFLPFTNLPHMLL